MNDFTHFVSKHRDWFIDFVRIFLGIVLIVKGVGFLQDMATIMSAANPEFQNEAHAGLAYGTLAHFIIFANILGGVFLIIGFLTRIVIPFQFPIFFLGLFVGPFRKVYLMGGSPLEYVMIVVLLILVLLWGDGRLSVDFYLEHKKSR